MSDENSINARIDAFQAANGLAPARHVEPDGARRAAAMRAPAPEPLTLDNLTDAQREAILGIAGDDRAKQESALRALAPTWGRSAADPTLEIEKTNPWLAARMRLANGHYDDR